ncbi:MAG: thiamine diphosphokinase [Clostridia bacterium]
MQNSCYIIGGGLFEGIEIKKREGDLIIAADKGYDFAKGCGIEPDIILGDFDSISKKPEGSNVLIYPEEKDDTDTMIAIKYALAHGYKNLVLFCCMGNRLDHTLANIQSIAYASRMGANVVMHGRDTDCYAVTNGILTFDFPVHGIVSVFCIGKNAVGVNLVGLKYPLNDATLIGDFPIGTSNEFLGEPASIFVRNGTLLVIHIKALDK